MAIRRTANDGFVDGRTKKIGKLILRYLWRALCSVARTLYRCIKTVCTSGARNFRRA